MCGRFSIVEIVGIEERFGIETPDLKPNYNVAPKQDVPVITGNLSSRRLRTNSSGRG